MNILKISKIEKEAVIKLDSNELVTLCNILYHKTKEENANEVIYRMYDMLMLARDLSQYGFIDSHCLDSIVNCRNKLNELKDKERFK